MGQTHRGKYQNLYGIATGIDKHTKGTKALKTDPSTCGYLLCDRCDVTTTNGKRMDHSVRDIGIK